MKAVLTHARLLADIASMKLFVWALGHDGELLDSDLFFFDRYSDLSDYHRKNGRLPKADLLAAIAEAYFRAAPDDEPPPETAAAAMPVPRPITSVNAVSTAPVRKTSTRKPGNERSQFVPSFPN